MAGFTLSRGGVRALTKSVKFQTFFLIVNLPYDGVTFIHSLIATGVTLTLVWPSFIHIRNIITTP